MKSLKTLFFTELKLSIRDMNVPLFGIIQPVMVVVLIGLIYGSKPAFEGASYTFLEQSFGAFASIAICATGLMGLPLILSDYRHKKILRRFMVTPVSPAKMLLVQFLVSFIMSLIALGFVYFACAVFWGYKMHGSIFDFFTVFLLVVFAIYSIGMMIASIAPNIKTASLLSVIVYFPMLFFSGATIPYEIMPRGAQAVMDLLPLTHGIKLLKATALGLPFENTIASVVILLAVGVGCTLLSIKFFRWE